MISQISQDMIERLQRSVDLHTRMEIPPRDIIDIVLPQIMRAFRLIQDFGNISETILVIRQFVQLSDYLELRLEHQRFGAAHKYEVADKMLDASKEIAKGLLDYVEKDCRA